MALQTIKENMIFKVLFLVFLFSLLLIPSISFGSGIDCSLDSNRAEEVCKGLVPCGNPGQTPCEFKHIVALVKNIINFITIVAFSVSIIMFSYAGVLYLTAGGSPSKIESAHKVFTTVLIGLIFIFAAWLIVNTVASVLLNQDFFEGSFKFFFNV